jgi:hypothetical protein
VSRASVGAASWDVRLGVARSCGCSRAGDEGSGASAVGLGTRARDEDTRATVVGLGTRTRDGSLRATWSGVRAVRGVDTGRRARIGQGRHGRGTQCSGGNGRCCGASYKESLRKLSFN